MFTPPGLASVTQNDDLTAPSVDQSAPNVDLGQPDAGVGNIAQNAAQQAVPAAQAPQGSKWARVAQGALAGFIEGGLPGAVVGAADPNTALQIKQQQAQVRATQSSARASSRTVRYAAIAVWRG